MRRVINKMNTKLDKDRFERMLSWSKVHSIIIPFCTFAVSFEREQLQRTSDDTKESGCFRMIE